LVTDCILLSDTGEHPRPPLEIFNATVHIDGLDPSLCAVKIHCAFCEEWWAAACDAEAAEMFAAQGFFTLHEASAIEWLRNLHAHARGRGFATDASAILGTKPAA
jgi:hypothetical protein